MCTIYGILLHFTLFCWNISVFYDLRCSFAKSFLSRFTCFCVESTGEKFTRKLYLWRKNYKYQVCMFIRVMIITIITMVQQHCRHHHHHNHLHHHHHDDQDGDAVRAGAAPKLQSAEAGSTSSILPAVNISLHITLHCSTEHFTALNKYTALQSCPAVHITLH